MEGGLKINFAYDTFRWDSDSEGKAHVHCVIVGFSFVDATKKLIYNGDKATTATNINAYLKDEPSVFIESRNATISDVPQIGIGNQPIDGGNYLFKPEEKDDFIKKEPKAEKYFKLWLGADEFINNRSRYCLWLGDCSPAELRSMPLCLDRVANVRELRLNSSRSATKRLADTPTRFQVENMPSSDYILIPSTSSERRPYVPMGFMDKDTISSNANLIIPDASIYHFGVLTSSLHMAWMRRVAGRLKSDYRYSKDIVYNNFVWPQPSEAQRSRIEVTAHAILEARALYPDSSLADLYDELTMPIELRRAHQANDRAVLEAYGLATDSSEEEMVAHMFKLYQEATSC